VEYLSEYGFRPLAHLVVRALLPLRVAPTWLVVFHTLLGVLAGWLISQGLLVVAAVLIQAKTVLDNADGQLARASGMVTETGRYLDTEGDLIVNAALFWGVGSLTNQPVLALIALIVLTVLLSSDFNLEYLYRRERGEPFRFSPDRSKENQQVLQVLEWLYTLFFRPQDNLVRWLADAQLRGILNGQTDAERIRAARLTYHDADTLFVLANLELSTQLFVLGVCLILGQPVWYLWFVMLCGLVLIGLQVRRVYRARRVFS
jgi:phosphatidylglycerophosphate synthase